MSFLKDAWYDGGAGEHRNMADARVKAEHQAKRKMLAHLFAQKTIANLEPVMAETTAVLIAQVDKHISSGTDINMRRYLNYFTIDLFSELLYGMYLLGAPLSWFQHLTSNETLTALTTPVTLWTK